MRMSLNIEEGQRNAVIHMLTLRGSQNDSSSGSLLWKILVFDKACQNMLSPLMKVGSLRQHGVTLNLLLETDRSPVPGVPAVYLVEPTEENIKLVVKDMQANLYQRYFINFSTTITANLLEMFAKTVAQTNCARLVESVTDRFIHFVSLAPNEFSLDFKGVFKILHGIGKDAEIEALLNAIVDRLLSVIVTLGGVVPIIRCPSHTNSPAHIIGRRLHGKIKEFLSNRGTRLFSSASNTLLERPCLILLDRELDMSVMAHHTWSYQTLVHDLFTLRLNRVSVPPTAEELNTTPHAKPKIYDLDSSDQMWQEFGSKAFPEAAVAISSAFQEYASRKNELDEHKPTEEIEAGLKTTIDSLTAVPELIMKKKSLDTHTNIAHRIVAEITERGLDRFYEVEANFEAGSIAAGLAQLEKLLASGEKGTPMDKARATFCFYLAKQNQLTSQNITKLKSLAQSCGGSFAAIDFIQHLESFKALHNAQAGTSQAIPLTVPPSAIQTVSWGGNLIDRSRDLLQGVRNLLPLKKNLPVCQTVLEVMDMKATSSIQQNFLYLDPKAAVKLGVEDEAAPRVKNPFRQGIVFCIGGGSYVESHALKELASKHSKQILYGSTDFVSPSEFMQDLEILGTSAI